MNNDIETINVKIKEWDTNKWDNEINQKSSLLLYNNHKSAIKEETYYNKEKSLIKFRFKTNTLNLNFRKRHTGENTECP